MTRGRAPAALAPASRRAPLERLREIAIRPEWAIGIYAGDDPLALAPAPGVTNPVLTRQDVTDTLASFVADPFMIRVDGTWHMFFEVLGFGSGARRGVIAHATSPDGARWTYDRVVLEEPFHLSYPHVFAAGADLFMIPESYGARAVRLYRAEPFPHRWTHVADLLRGPVLLDTSVFRHERSWWLLTETERRWDTLRLFFADELTGPWREHPRSPIVRGDPRASRPAGRVIQAPGRVVRLAQECAPSYGTGVRAFEVTELSRTRYAERDLGPALAATGAGWNADGMHHLDAHPLEGGRWIACVDGRTSRALLPGELVHAVADRWRRWRA